MRTETREEEIEIEPSIFPQRMYVVYWQHRAGTWTRLGTYKDPARADGYLNSQRALYPKTKFALVTYILESLG